MKRSLALLLALLFCLAAFAACGVGETSKPTAQPSATGVPFATEAPSEAPSATDAPTEAPTLPLEPNVTVRVGAMTGPTGIGMVKMMETYKASDAYDFTVKTAADQLSPMLLQGELDAAAVPANLAAILYNKSQGKIRVAAINTLGVLSILERGESIKTLADL
ncbi:MAG: ABC transporter substrate-binding protein, partial [Clostridia bacterium]|nr:ABC transporter substrate-binding protein [Clostridia bacterium]